MENRKKTKLTNKKEIIYSSRCPFFTGSVFGICFLEGNPKDGECKMADCPVEKVILKNGNSINWNSMLDCDLEG